MYQLRVWSEELPESRLRITWGWVVEPDPRDAEAEMELVRRALQALSAVKKAKVDNPGLVLTMAPGSIDRAELAATVRTTLGAGPPLPPPAPLDPDAIRVWAEELEDGLVRLSWEVPPETGARDEAADRRVVAAWLAVHPSVAAVRLEPGGVVARFDAARLARQELAGVVRRALCLRSDLRARASDLMKRSPVYMNLARAAALDQRVSPVPGMARQAAQQRATPANAALRFVPGFALVNRMQTLLPVIQGLSAWSYAAPPEVVDEHLGRVGLTREQLTADYATAQEGKLYLREAASNQANKAGSAARSALDAGRGWFDRHVSRPESA